nr:TaqI-like C-terminal specificity domain-containing protein [Candidatus Sigynarchaeota archaeon]
FQQSTIKHSIPLTHAKGRAWIFAEPWVEEIKRAITQQPVVTLEDRDYFEVRGGFQPPVNQAKLYEINKTVFDGLPLREQRHAFPLVHDANEIKRYTLRKRDDRYWIVANQFATFDAFATECPVLSGLLEGRIGVKSPGWWQFPNIRNESLFKTTTAKLLTPRTANKPTFAFDDKKHVFKGTNTMIVSKILNPKYVLGVLNSEISFFWHHQFSFDYHGGTTRKFEPAKVRMSCIPVKLASIDNQRTIIERVDMIIDRLSHGNNESSTDVNRIQKEIDDIVYTIYGISAIQREEILRSLHFSTTVTRIEQGEE